MKTYQFNKGAYQISTDKSLLDFEVIHNFLKTSYWSENIPMEIVRSAAQHSLAFGIYLENHQVGYARIISDFTTFAYLADVFVLESERNKGLSKWLMECVMSIPELQGLRRWSLATRDAHGLYAQFGFSPLKTPESFMEIARPDIYKNNTDAN